MSYISILCSLMIISLLSVVNLSNNSIKRVDLEQSFYITNLSGGKKITATNNKEIILKFQGNPTTGYEWYIKNPESIDSKLLIPQGLTQNENLKGYASTEYYKSDNEDSDEMLAGSGGVYTFKFKPQNTNGLVDLEFVYMRSWDTKDDPSKVNIEISLVSDENNTLQSSIVTNTENKYQVQNSLSTIKALISIVLFFLII